MSAVTAACWNTIGVRGDRSCPELRTHGHCRNCPVYSAAAVALLESAVPDAYVEESTRHFAEPRAVRERNTHAVLVFRVATEWLALAGVVITEVTNLPAVHSLPHRRGGAVLGLANVRGELLVCVSLGHLLGLEAGSGETFPGGRPAPRRLLVIRSGDVRVVCPVDEVHGVLRFHPRELKEVPATVAKATSSYSRALLSWEGRTVGLLDDQLLFYALKRSLA